MGSQRVNVSSIVDQAESEFAEHGFEGMSMRVLAEKCSVTHAALYYHFASKDELYDEVCNRMFDNVVSVVDTAMQGATTAEQKVEIFVATLFDVFSNERMIILSQRDIINAAIDPEHTFSLRHHRRLFGMIQNVYGEHFGHEMDDALPFTLCALIFGYGSLLFYSQQALGQACDAYQLKQKRKHELVTVARELMRARLKIA